MIDKTHSMVVKVADVIDASHKEGHFLDIKNDRERELYLQAMGHLYEAQSLLMKAYKQRELA